MRKYIKDILYSKESIQINLLCHSELIERQSIKNPAPLEVSGVCGRARAAANPTVQANFQTKRATVNSSPSLKMAPPRGLEPRTWWLQVTRNYFRTWTISLPFRYKFNDLGIRCIVSEPSRRKTWRARLLITLGFLPAGRYVRASSTPYCAAHPPYLMADNSPDLSTTVSRRSCV